MTPVNYLDTTSLLVELTSHNEEDISLDQIIQKVTAFANRVLELNETLEGIERSYNLYADSGLNCALFKEKTLNAIEQLNELKGSYKLIHKEVTPLVEDFAEYDTIHHVTHQKDNHLVKTFQEKMKQITDSHQAFDKILILKIKYSNKIPKTKAVLVAKGCCPIL